MTLTTRSLIAKKPASSVSWPWSGSCSESLPLKIRIKNYRQETGDKEHYRVPGNRVLGRIWAAKDRFGVGAEFREESYPHRIRRMHLDLMHRLAEIMVNKFDDQAVLCSPPSANKNILNFLFANRVSKNS